jgi:hypothetical protein
MEQTLVDDIVSILENYSVHNDFDGFLKVPSEEVAIALEKMFITKMNEEKRKILKVVRILLILVSRNQLKL